VFPLAGDARLIHNVNDARRRYFRKRGTNMLYKILGLATLVLNISAAQAQSWYQMDSPEKIKSGLSANPSRIYFLKPATTVRKLPVVQDAEKSRELVLEGQGFAKNAYSALLIEDGNLVFEEYGQSASANTPLNSFSVAKSLTALAVGEALCAGKIKSLDESAEIYAPELKGTAYGAASIRDLLRYTSGAEDPGGNGYVGIHNRLAFNNMVEHKISLSELAQKYGDSSRFKAGEKFVYNGLNSDSLSLVVRGATGMSLPAWFESTVWQDAGGEFPAAWFLDKDGNGIAEVLVFATTRDFARIGLYVLERLAGKAGSTCIQQFVQDAAKPQVTKGYWPDAPFWGLGLHTGSDGNTWMFGYGGQRIGINVNNRRVFATNSMRDTPITDSGARSFLK
jgi:CubicO group peptidase (beta-lactamase class C family)